MSPKGYILSPEAYKRTEEAVKFYEQNGRIPQGRTQPRPRQTGLMFRYAELTATLNAASNSKTGATTAAAKFLVPDPANPGDLMDGDAFTVTNRSLDSTGLSGDFCIVERIGSEWGLIWIDC